jgi:hypothetical protein
MWQDIKEKDMYLWNFITSTLITSHNLLVLNEWP